MEEAILGIVIGLASVLFILPTLAEAFSQEQTKKKKHMYYVQKTMEISAAHQLSLDYESKCRNLHGHNWIVVVHCKARELNQNGMVEDFALIKARVEKLLDHKNLNEVLDFNPTAENMARWICEQIPTAYKVSVQESTGNKAIYVAEGSDEDQ